MWQSQFQTGCVLRGTAATFTLHCQIKREKCLITGKVFCFSLCKWRFLTIVTAAIWKVTELKFKDLTFRVCCRLFMLIESHSFYLSLSKFYSHMHVPEFTFLFHRPLGPENLLLRGARLKNTREIFGELLCCKQRLGWRVLLLWTVTE